MLTCQYCGSHTCPRVFRSSLNCYGYPAGIGLGVGDVHPWRGEGPGPRNDAMLYAAEERLFRDVQENGT